MSDSILQISFSRDSILANRLQTITLVSRERVKVWNDTRTAYTEQEVPKPEWEGLASLQAIRTRAAPDVDPGTGAEATVPTAYVCRLPFELTYKGKPIVMRRELLVRGAAGREYSQTTDPINVGGAGNLWELRLGALRRIY